MRLARKTDDAGHRDVGVTDFVTKPERRFAHRAIRLERVENPGDLGFASLHPDVGFLPMQQPLIAKTHGLVAKPGRQRADF